MELKLKDDTIVKEVIDKRLMESFSNYNKFIQLCSCDAPLGVLCLPKDIETILLREGYTRVYDLLNANLTKIKGLGKVRCYRLAACLDKFLSV